MFRHLLGLWEGYGRVMGGLALRAKSRLTIYLKSRLTILKSRVEISHVWKTMLRALSKASHMAPLKL